MARKCFFLKAVLTNNIQVEDNLRDRSLEEPTVENERVGDTEMNEGPSVEDSQKKTSTLKLRPRCNAAKRKKLTNYGKVSTKRCKICSIWIKQDLCDTHAYYHVAKNYKLHRFHCESCDFRCSSVRNCDAHRKKSRNHAGHPASVKFLDKSSEMVKEFNELYRRCFPRNVLSTVDENLDDSLSDVDIGPKISKVCTYFVYAHSMQCGAKVCPFA